MKIEKIKRRNSYRNANLRIDRVSSSAELSNRRTIIPKLANFLNFDNFLNFKKLLILKFEKFQKFIIWKISQFHKVLLLNNLEIDRIFETV